MLHRGATKRGRGEEANTWSFRKTLSTPSSESERCTVPVRKTTVFPEVLKK